MALRLQLFVINSLIQRRLLPVPGQLHPANREQGHHHRASSTTHHPRREGSRPLPYSQPPASYIRREALLDKVTPAISFHRNPQAAKHLGYRPSTVHSCENIRCLAGHVHHEACTHLQVGCATERPE